MATAKVLHCLRLIQQFILINNNTKLLNIKYTAASVGFISSISITFLGCLGSAIGKDAGRCIDQSLHGVGSNPGKST